jgi:hypothetical protein
MSTHLGLLNGEHHITGRTTRIASTDFGVLPGGVPNFNKLLYSTLAKKETQQ